MRILTSLFLIIFSISFSNAQIKTYSDSVIADILHEECVKIGVKLVEAVNADKIKPYRTDSLDKIISIQDWKRWNLKSAVVNGFCVQFSTKSPVETIEQNLQLASVAPMYKPEISGIFLPQQPMFYVTMADFEKVVTENDKRLVIILSKLLFSTHDFYNTFSIGDVAERQKQDFDNFISYTIHDNINRPVYRLFYSKENLTILGREIIRHIAMRFWKKMYNAQIYTYDFSDIYEDFDLKKTYTMNSWNYKTGFCETVKLQNPADPLSIIDTTVCTPCDYSQADKLFLSNQVIGLGFDFSEDSGEKKVRYYTKRNSFIQQLPSWLDFLINTYLK